MKWLRPKSPYPVIPTSARPQGVRSGGTRRFALAAFLCLSAVASWAKDAYVFAYFKEPGSQGIYLALSRDGHTYTPLNDGQPWVKPEQPGEIMRDVFITRNPSGKGFRMVWTWGWKGNSLGYADSPDLMTWSKQVRVPIMQEFPTVRNTWAPETYWDTKAGQWLLLWSSSFSEDASGSPLVPQVRGAEGGANLGLGEWVAGLRIWASRTKDFKSFTHPAVFFDRGFPVIDATMFHERNRWFFVF
jgi:hypothetical protein